MFLGELKHSNPLYIHMEMVVYKLKLRILIKSKKCCFGLKMTFFTQFFHFFFFAKMIPLTVFGYDVGAPPPPPPPPPPQYIHTQHGIFFVAHTAIIVRTSKIASCLSQIFLILTGVSRDGRKNHNNEETPNHILWGARRNRYKTDKIAFFNFKNIHFSSN